MAEIRVDPDRKVIPRWRQFGASLDRGELAPTRSVVTARPTVEMLSDLSEDWKLHPGPSVASDFVSTAFLLGLDEVAIDAAQLVVNCDSSTSAARSLASLYLRRAGVAVRHPDSDILEFRLPQDSHPTVPGINREFRHLVHEARRKLSTYPRNAILWANLALLHTSLGVPDKADRAMQVARSLAPDNRFILRAASRFYLHQGDGERAHRILAQSPKIRIDPWILSAEVATAAAIGKTSRFVKESRRILEQGHFSPFHISELASAVGTLDAEAGNRKSGRKLVRQSLVDPSENSIAQAAWVARRMGIVETPDPLLSTSSEANAFRARMSAEWDTALKESGNWLIDQPFSSRPAVLGSVIASVVLGDHELALRFADQGFRCNPDDFILRNNYALFSLLSGNRDEGRRVLDLIDVKNLSPQEAVVATATEGMFAFRDNQPERGRNLYRQAISLAQGVSDVQKEVLARIYLAFEELRRGSPEADSRCQEAILASKRLTDPVYIAFANRLEVYSG